jgi:hypothetical protein
MTEKKRSPRQLARLALGELVIYNEHPSRKDEPDRLAMVIGCWRWGADSKTREDLFNVCPREVDWAQGYLLLPNSESRWVRCWFGDIDTPEKLRRA